MLTAQFQAKSFIWCYQKRGSSEQNHEVIKRAVQSKMLCLELPTEQFKEKCFIWCYQQSSSKEQNVLFGVINGAVRSNISEVTNKAVRSKMFCVELSTEQFEAKYFIWNYQPGSPKQHIWNDQRGSSRQNTLFGVINRAVRSNIFEMINEAVRGKMLYLELSTGQSEATYLKWSTRHLKQNVLFGVLMLISSVGWTKPVLTGCSRLGTGLVATEAWHMQNAVSVDLVEGSWRVGGCNWTNVLRSIRNLLLREALGCIASSSSSSSSFSSSSSSSSS